MKLHVFERESVQPMNKMHLVKCSLLILMRNIILILLTMVFLFSLTACLSSFSGSTSSTGKNGGTSSPQKGVSSSHSSSNFHIHIDGGMLSGGFHAGCRSGLGGKHH